MPSRKKPRRRASAKPAESTRSPEPPSHVGGTPSAPFRSVRLHHQWRHVGRTPWERIRLALSRVVFREALQRDWEWPRALASLATTARRHSRSRRSGCTSEPPNWNFRILQVVFSDIYQNEEFDSLARGLSRLRDAATSHRYFDAQRQDDWLRNLKLQSGGSSYNLGWLDLTRLPKSRRPRYLHYLHVSVIQVSPSVVVVSYVAHPTATLQHYFRVLATTDRPEEAEIIRFSLRHGITRLHHLLPEHERRLEVDDLFASANAEVTRILRYYVRCGTAMSGPLQQTRVIAFDQPIESLPESNFPRDSLAGQLWSFLRTLRYVVHPWTEFNASWYRLAETDSDHGKRREPGEYLLLVSSTSYFSLNRLRVTGGTGDDEMRSALEDIHRSLAVLTSIEAFFERLRLAVLQLRNVVAPLLHRRAYARTRRLSLGTMRATLAHLNELMLREERIWAEVIQSALWPALADSVEATRKEVAELHVTRAAFFDHVKQVACRGHDFVGTQIQLIRPAYKEVIDYETLITNDKLQRRVALLTAVATVAALAAVPEHIVLRIFEWFVSWLR